MSRRLSDLLRHGAIDAASPYARQRSQVSIAERLAEHKAWAGVAANMPLRIGYLAASQEGAKSHSFRSLATAAERIGYALVEVTGPAEIEAAGLDFVISDGATQPKATSVPTFACIHESRATLVSAEDKFLNLLSYDGYLTISDRLTSFLAALATGFDGDARVGHCRVTPALGHTQADVAGLAESGALRLCHPSVPQDPASGALLAALATRPDLHVPGSETARGDVTAAEQESYARYGVGLVTLPRDHLLDDLVCDSLFEIVAVGAIAVCPDTPWIRGKFGDSVFYYPADGSIGEMTAAIDGALADIRRDPDGAAARAADPRAIFDRDFCAERMLLGAARHFVDWRATAGAPSSPADDPLIDVIVRSGSDPESLECALRSIDAQLSGRFRIILVRHGLIDVHTLLDRDWDRIEHVDTIDVIGAGRAEALAVGLKAVRASLFAVLDGSDAWLSHHVRTLLRCMTRLPTGRGYAHGATLIEEAGAWRVTGGPPAAGTVWDILGRLRAGVFIASSELLRASDLDEWAAQGACETLLYARLAADAEVAFSWRATACVKGHMTGGLESTTDDERLASMLLLGTRLDRLEGFLAGPPMTLRQRLADTVLAANRTMEAALLSRGGAIVLDGGIRVTPLHNRTDVVARELPLGSLVHRTGDTPITGDDCLVAVLPPPQPWALGASRTIAPTELFEGEQWIVLAFDRLDGSYGVGLRDHAGAWITRMEAPASTLPMELWFHVVDPSQVAAFGIENWAGISHVPALLRAAWVVRRAEASGTACPPRVSEPDWRDLTPDLSRMPWVKAEAGGLLIPATAPAGHAVYGPYLPIGPGSYEVSFDLAVKAETAAPCVTVEVVLAPDQVLAGCEMTGADVNSGPCDLSFVVPRCIEPVELETRVSHPGGHAIEVRRVRLRRLAANEVQS